MNQLVPQKVYVPVDANDELPDNDVKTIFYRGNLDTRVGQRGVEQPFTHWLKEQSLYCLTKEELEAAFKECIELAREEHIPANRWHPKQLYSESEIIKQLLP